MPRKRRNVSGADYVWFAALMLFLFALLTGGIYLLVKVLWFPVRKLDSRNTRVVFVILAIGMIVMAAGLLAYQSLSGPDGMSMSSRLSTNVKGFTAFSIFSYFVAIFVTFAYEGELRNAQTMARTMVISPPAIASEYIDPSPSKDDNLSMSITPSSTLRKPDVAEFTHKIWHPQDGKNIEGQKIAIVGYSHYLRGNNIDNENVTTSSQRYGTTSAMTVMRNSGQGSISSTLFPALSATKARNMTQLPKRWLQWVAPDSCASWKRSSRTRFLSSLQKVGKVFPRQHWKSKLAASAPHS
jgi:hypothetical protein